MIAVSIFTVLQIKYFLLIHVTVTAIHSLHVNINDTFLNENPANLVRRVVCYIFVNCPRLCPLHSDLSFLLVPLCVTHVGKSSAIEVGSILNFDKSLLLFLLLQFVVFG